MKVYVARHCDWEEHHIVGVFAEKQPALDAAARESASPGRYRSGDPIPGDRMIVEEWELDALPEGSLSHPSWYQVFEARTGRERNLQAGGGEED